jgi:hypothetical protein
MNDSMLRGLDMGIPLPLVPLGLMRGLLNDVTESSLLQP